MRAGRYLRYGLCYLLALVWFVPVVWMAVTAVKPTPEVMSFTPRWIPSEVTFSHFGELLAKKPFFLWLLNSFQIAALATAITVVVTTFAAYALARLEWRGRNVVFTMLILAMFVPWEINSIPLFFIVKDLGLLNTFLGAALPLAALPVSLFLLRQFFINIPTDLEDAARIDGCGHLGILWHVIIPVSLPAYGALSIFIFIFSWNEFFWSLISLQRADVRTLPIGLKTLVGAGDIQYDLMMAGSFMATLPALIIFLILRRHIISGISMAGVRR
ncbi:carbohydrate ABC transporter permease [Jiella sonneratiae]|uniref:sn-glycerol-3-phosphate transport system permease protein UgpE n=1 Tax=Jiella sonneratiae TaxID=2816856 RepID=A0ABS3J3I6_9HYPH|nr:carbohydrate ABC transporter permease [Jiella sonneratiae]MBO0904231.1 carbohydrate ABC transporter permease [Jiella sonneratiae]